MLSSISYHSRPKPFRLAYHKFQYYSIIRHKGQWNYAISSCVCIPMQHNLCCWSNPGDFLNMTNILSLTTQWESALLIFKCLNSSVFIGCIIIILNTERKVNQCDDQAHNFESKSNVLQIKKYIILILKYYLVLKKSLWNLSISF